jgi:Ca2+-binding EF-hand superfamily protein
MSKVKAKAPTPTPAKGSFDPKSYAKNGVTEEEVTTIKTAFDLFDTDQGGSIDIKGNSSIT